VRTLGVSAEVEDGFRAGEVEEVEVRFFFFPHLVTVTQVLPKGCRQSVRVKTGMVGAGVPSMLSVVMGGSKNLTLCFVVPGMCFHGCPPLHSCVHLHQLLLLILGPSEIMPHSLTCSIPGLPCMFIPGAPPLNLLKKVEQLLKLFVFVLLTSTANIFPRSFYFLSTKF
jgi:hypothetical protein